MKKDKTKEEKTNLHAGHREKTKQKFCKSGFESFGDHEILEMILYFAIPRKDTNPIAHRLINTFKTLPRVFDASIEELMSVDGIGLSAATLIKTYPAFSKRYFEDKKDCFGKTPTYEELGERFVVKFAGMKTEAICAVFFNNSMKVCGEEMILGGDINSVKFSMRDLADKAIRHGAVYMVIAHNHPDGLPIASSNDLHTTANMRIFFSQMNVDLIDHFIVADNKYSSISPERYKNA